jgi:hypothetical protein
MGPAVATRDAGAETDQMKDTATLVVQQQYSPVRNNSTDRTFAGRSEPLTCPVTFSGCHSDQWPPAISYRTPALLHGLQ